MSGLAPADGTGTGRRKPRARLAGRVPRRSLRSSVLIADEPTAEQDPVTREIVLARMLAVAAEGGAVILATHDPDVADRCDTVFRLAHHIPAA